MQEYQLGEWLRNRYSDFLPSEYSEKDVYIRSTDVDRTLMSAETNLAGLYPPKGKQIWDGDIPWQPIPIHTVPDNEDPILAMKKHCPKYLQLHEELMQTKEFVELNYRFRPLMNYVSENSGTEITSFETLEYIYNTLFIESINNFTLPNWTKSVFPDKMKPVAALSFAVPCYTTAMARLKAGPLFNEFIEHIRNVTESIKLKEHVRKLWVYSGHDTTISNILQSLKLFDRHCPPYTSTILFEIRSKGAENYYVNVLYKNSSEPQKLTIEGCDYDCPLEEFVKLLEPIKIKVPDWEKECRSSFLALIESADRDDILVVAGVLLISLVIFTIMIKVIYSKYNKSETVYLRLPDDDEQV